MAYGIEVIGEDASGSYKVTDTNLDLVNYAVVATGTGSTISMTTGSSGTGGKKTILLINANQSGNTGKIISCGFGGFSKVMKKLTFSTDQYNNISVSSSASATVDYILLKDMNIYANCLHENGVLLLSGFYQEDISMIDAEVSKYNLKLESFIERNNWVALKYNKL